MSNLTTPLVSVGRYAPNHNLDARQLGKLIGLNAFGETIGGRFLVEVRDYLALAVKVNDGIFEERDFEKFDDKILSSLTKYKTWRIFTDLKLYDSKFISLTQNAEEFTEQAICVVTGVAESLSSELLAVEWAVSAVI